MIQNLTQYASISGNAVTPTIKVNRNADLIFSLAIGILMIHKLPKWVEASGFLLASIAGSINSVGLLGFKSQAVSHLTGASTYLSLEMAVNNTSEIVHLLLVIFSFLIGAILSGFIVGDTVLKIGKYYSFVLIIESIFLLIAYISFKNGSEFGYYLSSAACGLQNAITSSFSGSVIRTTHVSGLFTDIGIMIGLRFRGKKADNRKVVLCCILIFGFISGGVIGAVFFKYYNYGAILFPSVLSATVGICYWLYLRASKTLTSG